MVRQEPRPEGIDLEVHKGELVVLIGPSGSGKSTLLRCVNALERPDAGEVLLAGERMDAARKDVDTFCAPRSGWCFSTSTSSRTLTALKNVALAPRLVRGQGDAKARALLERVGLADKADVYPDMLSGGQKQRVAIARAIAGRPPVLLAAEPTANLDTATGTQVLDLFRELAKSERRGLLIVTHDPKARRIADRVVGIRDGRLVDEDAQADERRV